MKNKTVALILTAGKGKRMKSKLIKNLHPLSGKPLIKHLVESVKKTGIDDIALVIGNDADKVKASLGEEFTYIYQHELLGTGHAVMKAEEFIRDNINSTIVVFLGDGPLVTVESLEKLIATHQQQDASATLLTSIKDNPHGYGRIVRDKSEAVKYTVEEKDATEAEKKIKEVWAGICCYQAKDLLESLAHIDNDNAQGEYYLPDTFKHLLNNGYKVLAVKAITNEETLNVNDRAKLAVAEKYLNDNYLHQLMHSGVTIISPETTIIESSVKIAPDTTILPFTYLTGNSTIGTDCVIGPYTHVINSTIGDNVAVERSTIRGSKIAEGVKIGPFAYLRPNTIVKSEGKVGTFVEVKNSVIGKGSKTNHLSYVGDTDIGDNVNLGAGTIIVNYDGVHKHRTTIEDDAFVGCNSNLVAPVKIQEGAYVAAGSTVTEDVPPYALAIARSRQVNKENWVLSRNRVFKSKKKH